MTSVLVLPPSLLCRFQGALAGVLWGCDLADRSRLAYHLGQAVAEAIARNANPPIALDPTVPLVEALALVLPSVLLSFNDGADEDANEAARAFETIVANHGDREVLGLWRRLLLRSLAGDAPTAWIRTALGRGTALSPSTALHDSLGALGVVQPFRQSLGQVLDRIQATPELTIAERSLVQAIGLGQELQGQIALLDRYSQRQRSQLEAASRPLLFSLIGTAGRLDEAPLGPLGLDAQRWGESLLRSWAGILGHGTGSYDSRQSPTQTGIPAVTSGIQPIRL
jgi:hypothetical protein